VIVAGQGVLFADATAELRALASRLGAPVMTTMNGKSAFPEDDELALGAAGASGTEMAARFLERADLILGVGTSFTVTPFTHPIPRNVPLIQITADERDVNKDYAVQTALVGDAKLVLAQLSAALADRGIPRRETLVTDIANLKREWLAGWLPRLTSDDVPLSPYRVIHELGRAIDRRNAIVTHDSGNPRDQLLPFYEALAPRGYLGWGKSTQLGYGYGLSLGAKLAAPSRLVVNVMGDAAFGMVGMDVETCGARAHRRAHDPSEQLGHGWIRPLDAHRGRALFDAPPERRLHRRCDRPRRVHRAGHEAARHRGGDRARCEDHDGRAARGARVHHATRARGAALLHADLLAARSC
jgi:thiamine pyrophosphate-dependent acetolactate synthase large subunit-like protein